MTTERIVIDPAIIFGCALCQFAQDQLDRERCGVFRFARTSIRQPQLRNLANGFLGCADLAIKLRCLS